MKYLSLFLLLLFSTETEAQYIISYSEGDFEFRLSKTCDESECHITQIEVFENDLLLQNFQVEKSYFYHSFPKEQLFILEDMNFDGFVDFRLFLFLPAGPNIPYTYWIYNPKKKLFEENKNYETITSPEFNQDKKEIFSSWRDGCCTHGSDTYKIIDKVPTTMERFIVSHPNEDTEVYEHWKLIEGELKLIKKEEIKIKN